MTSDEDELPVVARNLRRLMGAALLRQSDVARQAGIARDALGRYVHGRNHPPPQKVAALARVLGCSPHDIDPALPATAAPTPTLPEVRPAPPPGAPFGVGPAQDGDPGKLRLRVDMDLPAADALRILSVLTGTG